MRGTGDNTVAAREAAGNPAAKRIESRRRRANSACDDVSANIALSRKMLRH
jgi:hypothetical protein